MLVGGAKVTVFSLFVLRSDVPCCVFSHVTIDLLQHERHVTPSLHYHNREHSDDDGGLQYDMSVSHPALSRLLLLTHE